MGNFIGMLVLETIKGLCQLDAKERAPIFFLIFYTLILIPVGIYQLCTTVVTTVFDWVLNGWEYVWQMPSKVYSYIGSVMTREAVETEQLHDDSNTPPASVIPSVSPPFVPVRWM